MRVNIDQPVRPSSSPGRVRWTTCRRCSRPAASIDAELDAFAARVTLRVPIATETPAAA